MARHGECKRAAIVTRFRHIGLSPVGRGRRVKASFRGSASHPWSIDRQVRAAWPDLLPTAGATDGPLDRLPASLRAGAQASASSSGASRLWSRRARCLTTWTSRSTAAPQRADHLWCAPISCPSPSNIAAHLLVLASRLGGHALMCSSRPLIAGSTRRRLDPLIWELASVDDFEALPRRTGAELTRAHKVSDHRPSHPLRLRACS